MIELPQTGLGDIQITNVHGLSSLTRARSCNPLKLLSPRTRGPSVWVYSSSFGGGYVAGDSVQITLQVEENSRCFFGTQASTKVYRNPGLNPCRQSLRARINQGALLVLAPDPIQCFAGAQYEQTQSFQLAQGGSLVLVDWMSAGRAARGERWAFTRFHSRNEVRVEDKPVLLDSLLLDPLDGPLCGPQRMGRFNCLGTICIVGEALSPLASGLFQTVQDIPVVPDAPLIVAASPLPNGVILRFASTTLETAGQWIARELSFVRSLLQDDPWARKW